MARRAVRTDAVMGKAILLLLMAFAVAPLVSMLSAALQEQGTPPIGISFTSGLHWGNFVDAFHKSQFLKVFSSSSLIVLGVVPIAVIFATLAGYGLSRGKIPGERYLFVLFLAGLTLPPETLITPLYYQMEAMGLLGSRWSLILVLIGLYMPFGVYWMRSNFLSIPHELGEAAEIDGASAWQVFVRVHLPLAVPAWSSLVILFFLWTWNQFLFTIILIKDPLAGTMAGALNSFQGQYSTNVVLLSAGSLLIMAPSLIIFMAFQRQFVRALLQGSSR